MTATDHEPPPVTLDTGIRMSRRPMADSHELRYIDDAVDGAPASAQPVHQGIDRRYLEAAAEAGPMRLDVLTGEHWNAYVPTAARWPAEVHLASHRDVPDRAALDPDERGELAEVYPEMLGGVDRYFSRVSQVPYIAGWHRASGGAGRELERLHMQVFSVLRCLEKLNYLADSESTAVRLREVTS